jgi:hypothetical protein
MTHLADDPDDPYMFCLAVNKFHGDRIGLAGVSGYRRCALVQLGMGHSKLRLAVGSASAGVATSNDLMCKGKTWYLLGIHPFSKPVTWDQLLNSAPRPY